MYLVFFFFFLLPLLIYQYSPKHHHSHITLYGSDGFEKVLRRGVCKIRLLKDSYHHFLQKEEKNHLITYEGVKKMEKIVTFSHKKIGRKGNGQPRQSHKDIAKTVIFYFETVFGSFADLP